ncbi:MAG: M24 family metallopeptidase [Erysipelotrichaceae bacterium]|nr:M24 family metallopeptidase [Erysipelotrichaceae bacterium]
MISNEDFLYAKPAHLADLEEKILSYRERERVVDNWLRLRYQEVLPMLMKRCGIDAWVVACDEYNEDPVLRSLTPTAMMNARRTTILLFIYKNNEVLRYSITRPNVGLDEFYTAVWINQKDSIWCKDPSKAETQFECLARLLKENDVKKIGLNISREFAFADGLSKSMYDAIVACFDDEMKEKIVSAQDLCVGWLETRTVPEMQAYNGIMQIAHAMIAEAFSSRVVIPGVTTNYDVKYWMMEKLTRMGLVPWFDFEVSIIRENVGSIDEETIIMQGDMLHCDVGFNYLGLCTDTQENAYVLKYGETKAPDYLERCLHDVNRFQDIVISHFKEGRSGNEILKLSLEEGFAQGLKPSLYTHPIGYHGHAAGPTIGLWDKQQGVAGANGTYPMHDNTAYSLELNCTFTVKEWNNTTFSLGLETDVLFTEGKVYYLAGRQENFHLIK